MSTSIFIFRLILGIGCGIALPILMIVAVVIIIRKCKKERLPDPSNLFAGVPIVLLFYGGFGLSALLSCFTVVPKNSLVIQNNDVVMITSRFVVVPSTQLPIRKSPWEKNVHVVKYARQSMDVAVKSLISQNLTNLSVDTTIEYGGDVETMIATIRWDGVELTRLRSTVKKTIFEFYQERDFSGTETERDELRILIESKFPDGLDIRCTFLEVRRQ